MSETDSLTPTLPLAEGEEGAVPFRRGEHEFRLMRVDERLWVIQREHTASEDFEIRLATPRHDSQLFDASIVRNGAHFTATASTLSFVIAHFC